MFKRMFKGDKKMFFLSFISVFLAMSLILLAATMLIQTDANHNARVKIDISEQSLIDAEKYFITYKINRLTSDLQFIYETLEKQFATAKDLKPIADIWLSYSNSRQVFDQIRYIDTQGNEVVRIDYSPDGAFIVPQEQLQNKKDRYYFQQTIDLNTNQIFISALDLNVENGAIELPINPVIRLARPVFDQNGIKKGIVVLNYGAKDILTQISSIAAGTYGEVFFLNKDGYWLMNSKDASTEWAFSYNPESTVKFPNYYAKEWKLISAGGNGTMTTENGYFRYTTIPLDSIYRTNKSSFQVNSKIENWYIVSHIPVSTQPGSYPSSNLFDLAYASIRQYALLYAILFFFSIVLAGFITSSRTKSKEVKFFSEYDVMTSAYNRHAGISKLSDLYRSLSKSGCSMSVCFIDINGLKQINDTLGHESGDELIISVAKTIRAVIRSNDFLIRLGGDEFLIVFQNIDAAQAEEVWSRIVAEFEKINQAEHRKYKISVSHGIEMLSCDLNQVLDTVLHQADAKMYDEKRKIKSNLQIIREDQ